jgi:hypothetical protein
MANGWPKPASVSGSLGALIVLGLVRVDPHGICFASQERSKGILTDKKGDLTKMVLFINFK